MVACTDRSTLLSDTNLEVAFRMLDKDGSGSISKKDIQGVFSQFNLHDRVLQDLLKTADKKGDGKITKDEYLNLMKQKSTNEPQKASKK